MVLDDPVGALNDTSDGHKVQLKVHGTRLTDNEHKIERIERERRRSTLVIDGVVEKEGEALGDIVNKVFGDLHLGFQANVCAAIFRRGKGGVGDNQARGGFNPRPRPIVIIFHSQADKATIFKNLKNLKGKDDWKNVYFNDDLTEQQASEHRDLRALSAFAKTKGYNSNVRAGALWLEGRKYRYEDLHHLPDDISLIKAKILIYWRTKQSFFKVPIHPCPISTQLTSRTGEKLSYQQRQPSNIQGP